ncbi:hypothetical protein IFM89_014301 [Coptis chinensis]|uniref:Uncharacterized protein n=1 Tax=Coptis chinensis TaxID=261450 RepID=A0A835HXM3_9MAGN|nr:hypothetical protein IFM89_014301 [Coptis chinensis]
MDEAMKYCMEYIPSSKREIHKQEEKAALDDKTECGYPIDKKGKDYLLPSLQYQQARKWVLRKSSKNVEWERDNWHVVLHAPKRLNHDVDVYEDPLVFEAMANSDGLASALMGDIDGVEV